VESAIENLTDAGFTNIAVSPGLPEDAYDSWRVTGMDPAPEEMAAKSELITLFAGFAPNFGSSN
jgi:hypothetical protein